MAHNPIIRTIYLYLFALVGLILVIVGGVRLLDMGLKTFIFTEADRQEEIHEKFHSHRPPLPELTVDKITEDADAIRDIQLTESEQLALERWVEDFEAFEQAQEDTSPLTSRRQRDLANILATIIIGLPLYLYHWNIIKRETRRKKE